MDENQILHRLLEQFLLLQREHSAMRLVLRAATETHPNRAALLERLQEHIYLQEETDQGQPLSESAIADRRAAAERWRGWIERAP